MAWPLGTLLSGVGTVGLSWESPLESSVPITVLLLLSSVGLSAWQGSTGPGCQGFLEPASLEIRFTQQIFF